jgi:SAM-dependent methyltransferase
MPSPAASSARWSEYLAAFHHARPGITEQLLLRAHDDAGRTPYDWLAEAVPAGRRVLDLACGSAPTAGALQAATYVGLDLSRAELALAAARGLPVAQADATRLPLPDGAVEVVTVSMSLQLLPLPMALQEVRRVLRPGGLLVATVPASRPVPLRELPRLARLLLALRVRGLGYPNDDALADAPALLAGAGLTLLADEAVGFRYPVADRAAADRLVDALYLPGTDAARLAAARRVARRWTGTTATVPVRRLLARG